MQRIGSFERVSFQQFEADMKSEFGEVFRQRQNGIDDMNMLMNLMFGDKHGFEPMTDEEIRVAYSAIRLPVRATSGSAGYDIRSPFSFLLHVGESIKIPTGLRVKIDDGWWLGCFPRSGLGFKYAARLANTVGVIDGDYYGSKNEGHIMLKLRNEGDANIVINAGDGVAQAIFIPFGITVDDNATGERDGGFGSTGR